MNRFFEEELPGLHDLRDQLLDMISDQDLAYTLPGQNPTFGDLIIEMGTIQQCYTRSFRTFTMEWDHQGSKPDAANSVASLKAWFATLDADLVEAVGALADEDVTNRQIDRGHGFTPTPNIQFMIYREALFIFSGKASVYLKALEKRMTDQWRSWIG